MTMNYTAVIAEDEPILRAQLRAKLGRMWPELGIVAEVGDGEAALEAIDEHRPQLAFLDIQMPEMTGVEVAKSLAASALSQRSGDRQTGAKMEDTAARVLASDRYASDTKELAASVLSQANKQR